MRWSLSLESEGSDDEDGSDDDDDRFVEEPDEGIGECRGDDVGGGDCGDESFM
ncbi:hypothetical protein D3C87_1976310 [compost metagenome]